MSRLDATPVTATRKPERSHERGTAMAILPTTIMVIATKAALTDAFNTWAERYEANPDEFDEFGDGGYGHDCAEYLISLLNESR